jgi:hypothetical protein
MTIALNRLLPNETLYSNFSRYVEEMGLRSLSVLISIIDKRPARFCINLYNPAVDFKELESEAKICWRMEARQIILQHTLFRYDTLFAPEAQRSILLSHAENNEYPKQRVTSRERRLAREELRYCCACIGGVKEAGFPGYFSLIHQLPGVLLCPIHGEPLRVVQLGWSDPKQMMPFSYERMVKVGCPTSVREVQEAHFPGLFDIARRSLAAFRGDGECMRAFPYKILIKEAGFSGGKTGVRMGELMEALSAYCGQEFCLSLAVSKNTLSRILAGRATTGVASTFRHIILQSLLAYRCSGGGYIPSSTCMSPHLEALKCPGVLHRQGDRLSVVKYNVKCNSYHVSCSCSLTLSVRCDGDGNVISFKLCRFGDRYKRAFVEMISAGMPARLATAQLNTRCETSKKWQEKLDARERTRTTSTRQITVLRRQWEKAIGLETGSKRITVAQRKNRQVYNTLISDDYVWLMQFNRRVWREGYAETRAAAALKEAMSLLEQARARLESLKKPVPITATALLTASGLSPSSNSQLSRFVNELRESREEFEERAFTYWIAHIDNGRGMSLDRFGQITGLAPLSNKLRERFEAWRMVDRRTPDVPFDGND